jgi:hypothetical protein
MGDGTRKVCSRGNKEQISPLLEPSSSIVVVRTVGAVRVRISALVRVGGHHKKSFRFDAAKIAARESERTHLEFKSSTLIIPLERL